MVKCPSCGNELEGNKNFCPKCGADVSKLSSNAVKNANTINNTKSSPQKSNSLKKVGIIVGALVVIAILAIIVIGMTTPDTTITVNDLKVTNEGWGLYKITGTLIPDKDYDYLEMVVVFYDKDGAIIDKAPLAWNMVDIIKDQPIKITGTAYVSGSESPSKIDVYFFDSVFSGGDLDSAIYHETLISGEETAASSSSDSSSSGSMSILSGTISTGSSLSAKTKCSVYVGSEHAGESVKISVLYSRDGSNLNQGKMVTKTVSSDGYINVNSADAFKKYPDNAIITIYDTNGIELDTRTVSLNTDSGSQPF